MRSSIRLSAAIASRRSASTSSDDGAGRQTVSNDRAAALADRPEHRIFSRRRAARGAAYVLRRRVFRRRLVPIPEKVMGSKLPFSLFSQQSRESLQTLEKRGKGSFDP